MRLLKIPVDSYSNILTLLKLENFIPLVNYFGYASRKEMSLYVVSNTVDSEQKIPSQEEVCFILTVVNQLSLLSSIVILVVVPDIVVIHLHHYHQHNHQQPPSLSSTQSSTQSHHQNCFQHGHKRHKDIKTIINFIVVMN